MMAHDTDLDSAVCVLHSCDNPACVNVAHLYLGTHADNVADKIRKGRSQAGRGGLPYGVERCGRRFRARIRLGGKNGKRNSLGIFDTVEEAAQAAMSARRKWIDESSREGRE